MTPPAIVRASVEAGLDLIAICDHNSAGNAAAVQKAAAEAGAEAFGVLAGMEITTAEEVHLVGLFPEAASAEAAGILVRETLPLLSSASKVYGEQYLLDSSGVIIGKEPHMLSMASGFTLEQAVEVIHAHGGLAVAAHVDRPSFSVISQLGFFPENVAFDAIEISSAGLRAGRWAEFAPLGFPMVTSSDSHFLSELGVCGTEFEIGSPRFEEVAAAFRADIRERRCRFA